MIWVKFAKKYLAAFAAKDLDTLDSEIYSDDVVLSDWAATTSGKEQVLIANKHLFNNCDMISIHIQNIAYNNKTIFVHFDLILIGGKEKVDLSVVDVIEINDMGKIKSITAFKK
jgi:limonene-1,2-epoxide hydrolase